MTGEKQLWKLVLEPLGPDLSHPFDERKLVVSLIELYAVGERPTSDEFDEFLRQRWPSQCASDRKRMFRLWQTVLSDPHHEFRILREGSPWIRPFVVLDQICAEAGLEPVADRLVREVGAAAERFVAAVESDFSLDEAEREARRASASLAALFAWGAGLDADEDWPSSPHAYRPVREATLVLERCTRSGRERERLRIEGLRARYEREFPPGQRMDG